jgi:diguanylate cyclase (GGDEF)-like protein
VRNLRSLPVTSRSVGRRPLGVAPLATLFVVVVCLSIFAIDGLRTFNARKLQLHEGEIANENLARSMAQQASDTLQQADAVLIGLVDRVESDGARPDGIERIHALLVQYAAAMPQFQRLAVIDENGRWSTTSLSERSAALDVSDREYFKFHQHDPARTSHLGPVIRARSNNQRVLTLSRRIDHADGRFAGIAVASIDLAHFDRFFAQFDIGPNGALTLTTTDGIVLDRRPFIESLIGSDMSGAVVFRDHISKARSGVATITSSIDHVDRQLAFRRLDDYPIVVFAALSTSDLLDDWQTNAITHSLFIFMLVCVLGFLGFVLVKQIGAKALVEDRLRASQLALEATNATLSALATKDGLTDLVNRREFDRVLAEEVSRAQRMRSSLTVIMLDVDFFKDYNDRYGHPAGDECLRQVATALASTIKRPGDVVARYGGEEFVVLLPGIDTSGAAIVAESLCRSVRALAIVHHASPKGHVTVSAGVAVLKADGKVSPSALLLGADAALYEAKRNGRDIVAWHRAELVSA